MFPRRGKTPLVEGPKPPTVEEMLDRTDQYLGDARKVLAQAKAILDSESSNP